MDGLRRLLDLLWPSDSDGHAARIAPPIAPIPAVIAARLIPDNDDELLFPKLKRFGRGGSGVAQEADEWWVIRDERAAAESALHARLQRARGRRRPRRDRLAALD